MSAAMWIGGIVMLGVGGATLVWCIATLRTISREEREAKRRHEAFDRKLREWEARKWG